MKALARILQSGMFLPLAMTVGCGAPVPEDSAAVDLTIHIPEPRWHSADTIGDAPDELSGYRPTDLFVMVCNDVTATTAVPCNYRDADSFHAGISFSLSGMNSGEGELRVPPNVNQVVFAQGLNAVGDVTYQGYATMPVIMARAHYSVPVTLTQVRFPDMLPPEAPVLTYPAAEHDTSDNAYPVAADDTVLVFAGTRQPGTLLRVQAPSRYYLYERSRTYDFRSGQDGEIYQDEEVDGVLQWTLQVRLEPDHKGAARRFAFTAVWIGRDAPGEETTRWICHDCAP